MQTMIKLETGKIYQDKFSSDCWIIICQICDPHSKKIYYLGCSIKEPYGYSRIFDENGKEAIFGLDIQLTKLSENQEQDVFIINAPMTKYIEEERKNRFLDELEKVLEEKKTETARKLNDRSIISNE